MVEVGPFQINEVRSWLGFRLDEVARWREAKAVDYPDDERNNHSAAALHGVAQYIRTVDQRSSHGLVRVTTIVEIAHQSGVDLLKPAFAMAPLPGFESQRVASRFGFDDDPVAADAMTHEEFLKDLADAIVRDLRERLFELEKDSPLAKLIRAEASPPLTPADQSLAALAELLELLHESRVADARSRRHHQIADVSALIARVRDVAIAEAAEDGSLHGLGPRTFPQTRMQLQLAIASYTAETGRELPSSTELAAGSSMTAVMPVVGAATSAFQELLNEAVSLPTAS